MQNRLMHSGLVAIFLFASSWAAGSGAASGKAAKVKPGSTALPVSIGEGKPVVAAPVAPAAPVGKAVPASPEKTKPALDEGVILQNILRIRLDRPVSISVLNVRGQLVFHLDSQRRMESVPLTGMPTGFLYLTLRSGPDEITQKLLYTGK